MVIKFTTEYMIKMLKDYGFNYISGESYNQYSKIKFSDSDGYLYHQNLNNLKRRENSTLKKFHISNPFTIDNIKLFLKLSNSKTELLSSEFVSANNDYLEWKCGSCNETFKRTWTKMFQSKTMLCTDCSYIIATSKTTKSDDEVNRILKSKGWKLLDGEIYIKNDAYINVINNEGYMAKTTLSNIVSADESVDIINKRNPYTLHNINLFLNKSNLPFEIISTEYKGNNEELVWKCLECGEVFKRTWSTFKSGKSILCPKCSLKAKSYISYCVMKWLEKEDISYEMEYKFDDCKDKRKLPFDYYLIDKNILIEVDGKHHYSLVPFGYTEKFTTRTPESRFENVKLHDKIKNEYVKKKNIKLIRLPYWLFKDNTYKEILEKEII